MAVVIYIQSVCAAFLSSWLTCLLERIMSQGKWNNPVEMTEGSKAAAVILHPTECDFIFRQKTTLSTLIF